jgi:hypothetical protein
MLQTPTQHEKTFKIFINAREKETTAEVLSYDDVLVLAYGAVPAIEENITYEVFYHHADQHPAEGELVAGGSVKIKNKTSFDVTRTIRS